MPRKKKEGIKEEAVEVSTTQKVCPFHIPQLKIITTMCQQIKEINENLKEIKDTITASDGKTGNKIEEIKEQFDNKINNLVEKFAGLATEVKIIVEKGKDEKEERQSLQRLSIYGWGLSVIATLLLTVDTLYGQLEVPCINIFGADYKAYVWLYVVGIILISGVNLKFLITKTLKKKLGIKEKPW